ncbi:hypothetical protein GT347_20010 [Xylophilus rhododendri]|uniref:Uncharacterized protein n=1 Tax=Xylophilus rhododendri TaxID=2697032 RepID=A0A857JA98_9BURK|nr:hypothetical protein [Xylophilus rhododendri]QHJ00062.1 hypothetical protein GT347_20010 [Xylophilus rhododendri]
MTQWTVKIETNTNGRYQWRHEPTEGAGNAHLGADQYDTPEAARQAGEQALVRHHENAAATDADGYALPETPQHDEDTRLTESQAKLESEEDPRLMGGAGLSISSLPLEAEVRTADEEGQPLLRH